jgi:serine/threonine protein kinase/WD40 repeat protein
MIAMAEPQPPTIPEAAATLTFTGAGAGAPAPVPPPEVPGYDVGRVVGRGGMGVVFEARDRKLQRTVALKMILLGPHAGPKELSRFRQEAEAVARLQHPGIVQIYEVGESPTGPFLALEYVAGGSLAERLDGKPWLAAAAARLVEQLAEAIEVAHLAGVVHRDLKPANVLLSGDSGIRNAESRPGDQTPPGDPNSALRTPNSAFPKITDFGLAKRLDSDQGNTNTGAILGTPSYMAPEQAEGKSSRVGPHTDVYALGAVLYELLTGRPPFVAETALDTVLQVSRQEPVPPSRLNPKVPLDLETICLKCLRKEPERRYPSAAALADDLRRFREGRPILARPVGPLERGWRWCRRNPGVAASLAAVALALVAGSVVASYFAFEAKEREREARASAKAATQSAAEATDARKRGEMMLYAARINLAQNALREHRLIRLRGLLRDADEEHRGWEWHYLNRAAAGFTLAQPLTDGPTQLEHAGCVAISPGLGKPRTAVLVPVDDPELRGAHGTLECRVRDPVGKLLFKTRLKRERNFESVGCALSEDGRRLAVLVDRRLTVWDVDTGLEPRSLMVEETTNAFALDPKGELLAHNEGGSILVRRVETGKVEHSVPTGGPEGASSFSQIDFSADGRHFYAGRIDAAPGRTATFQVVIYNLAAKQMRPAPAALRALDSGFFAASGDGRFLAVPAGRQTVLIWDVARGKAAAPITGVSDKIEAMALSTDGRFFAAGSPSGLIALHDRTDDGASPQLLRGHDTGVWSLAFANRVQLLSASADGELRGWNLGRPELRRLPGQSSPSEGSAFEPAFDRAGTTLAQVVTQPGGLFGMNSRVLYAWDTRTGAPHLRHELGLVPAGTDPFSMPRGKLALSPDGRYLAYGLFNQDDLDALRSAAGSLPGAFFRIGGAPGGGALPRAVVDAGLRSFMPKTGTVFVHDLARNRQVGSFPFDGLANELRFSPDGRYLQTDGGHWSLFEAPSGKLVASVSGGDDVARRAAFHPDGDRVALASSWNLRRGEVTLIVGPVPAERGKTTIRLGPFDPKAQSVTAPLAEGEERLHVARLVFGPGGKHLAVVAVGPERVRGAGAKTELAVRLIVWRCEADGSLTRLWGAPFGTMMPFQTAEPMAVAFAPGGESVAASALAGLDEAETRVWDLATGELRHTFRAQAGGADLLAFTPEGGRLIAADGTRFGADAHSAEAHVWDLASGQELLEIPLGSTISSSGGRTSAYHFDGARLRAAGWNDKGGELRTLDGSAAK